MTTTTLYVQFEDDTQSKIISILYSPPDLTYWTDIVEIQSDDPRYLTYINPPVDVLAVENEKLLGYSQLAAAQKSALTDRIGILNDSVELEIATPEEIVELPTRATQLKQWKTYAVMLGRVTAQAEWPQEVEWPAQPTTGMSLSIPGSEPAAV